MVEILRKGVTAEVLIAGLTQAQVASIAIFAFALAMMWRLCKRAAGIGTRLA